MNERSNTTKVQLNECTAKQNSLEMQTAEVSLSHNAV
jgi:hypothetical protein